MLHRRLTAPTACAALVAAQLAASSAGAAEAKTSSLSWIRLAGADTCIATQPLARAVEERLHRPVFVSAARADLSVEGRIEKRRGGWHAVVTVRDDRGTTLGTRELDRTDGSCDELTEPLVLAIALMIDPEAAMRPREATPPASVPVETPKPNEEPKPAAPPPPPPKEESPPPPPSPAPRPWRFDGEADGTIQQGLAPEPALGAGVEAILYPPGLPIGLRGYTTLFLPTSITKDGARASFDMLYAGGALCPTLEGRVRVMGCLGGQLGLLRPRAETTGRGIGEDLQPILNAMAEARLHAAVVGPFGIAMGVGGGIPIVRPEVDFRRTSGATDVLHKSNAFVISADLGVGVFFP